jgi:3-dehydroquinate synthase
VTDLTRVEVPLPERSYPILIGRGWLAEVADHVPLPDGAARALVVSQTPVTTAGHVKPVVASLERAGLRVERYDVPDGEPAKSTGVLRELWEACATASLSRRDLVVAVGGGVVTDLAGFAAATWNRGVAVLQVPTTLLGQVDAAIGGKTGINLPQGKNLVGAFHQPLAVAVDVATLSSLPERTWLEGFGEIVKYGLIHEPDLLDRLEADIGAARRGDPALLDHLVARSAAAKAAFVAADEREGGRRAHLNLGHTYGHAVEALTGYGKVLHGEAVAIGTVVALRIGVRLGRTPPQLAARTERLLAELGLPVRGPVLDRAKVWEVMGRDKKATAGGVRFVLLDGPGRPVVLTPPPAVVDEVLDELQADAPAADAWSDDG